MNYFNLIELFHQIGSIWNGRFLICIYTNGKQGGYDSRNISY